MHIEDLIKLIKAYCAHTGLTVSTVSGYAANDWKLFGRFIDDGADCSTRRARKLGQWFSDNWPDDLDWPVEIERPSDGKDAA